MAARRNNRVLIFDTTLRDGEQAPGASMTMPEKLEIARALERLGVDVIEAGFPITSPGDFEAVQQVAREIKRSIVCGLARCKKEDIDAACRALKGARHPRVHVFLATSKIHLEHKLKKKEDEILAMAVDAVRYAKKHVADVEFSPEDATRSDRAFLFRILQAVIEAGATTVNIPDTVGYAMPWEYGGLIREIFEHVPNIDRAVVSVHCHDDLGVAVANSITAVLNGARQVECTINGIGERAGNAAMEEIVMGLKVRHDLFHLTTGVETREIMRVSRLVSKATGFPVPPNKAIVGANAFRHESGIHQDGVLKNRATYEIMKPEDVGVVETGLVLGKHSGRHALKSRLKELGVSLTEEELTRAFKRFKDIADKKKDIYDEDLLAIVEDEIRPLEGVWRLEDLRFQGGMHVQPSVTVVLCKDGRKQENTSQGDGPVDACYRAIDRVVGVRGQLLDYSIQSVTRGKDALGEVIIKVKIKDKTIIARAADTDILIASAKAYLNAVNKVMHQQRTAGGERSSSS